MGRHKITISRITDDRARQCTFAKRRVGAFKKAMELSILCGCDVALITFSPTGKLHLYSSRSLDQILTRLSEHTSSPFRALSNADYEAEYGGIESAFDDDEIDADAENGEESTHPSGMKRKRPQKRSSSKHSVHSDDDEDEEEQPEQPKGPSINPRNGHRAPDANNVRNRMGFEQVKYAAMLATSSLSSSQSSQPVPQAQLLQPAYTVQPMMTTVQPLYQQTAAQPGAAPSVIYTTAPLPQGAAAAIPQQVSSLPQVSLTSSAAQLSQPRMVITQRPSGGTEGYIQGLQQLPHGATVIGDMPVFVQQVKQPIQMTAAQQAEMTRLQSMLIEQQQQQAQQQQQQQQAAVQIQQQQQQQPPPPQRPRGSSTSSSSAAAAAAVAATAAAPSQSPLTAFSAQPRLSIQDLLSLTAMESVQFWNNPENCASTTREAQVDKKERVNNT